MHHIDDRLVLSYVKDEIDRITDVSALRQWIRNAENEILRVIDNEDELNRDDRIEMLGSEIHYLQQRIYQLKYKK